MSQIRLKWCKEENGALYGCVGQHRGQRIHGFWRNSMFSMHCTIYKHQLKKVMDIIMDFKFTSFLKSSSADMEVRCRKVSFKYTN